ncbi:uncharacterized protein [Aristolochia californica]|uniref:uncharacterized protein n=1 Tax=Aristolochia californica TaxID=171875 RepID=UPI0035DEB3A6
MASLLYHIFSSSSLFSLGLYHLVVSTWSHLKSPTTYSARPYHPFPFHSSPSSRLRLLPLHLLIFCLLIAIVHQIAVSFLADPLVYGLTPVHRLSSLMSAVVLLIFLLLVLALLVSDTTQLLPLPPDLSFALLSAAFALQSAGALSVSAIQISDLHAKCDSLFARIAAIAALLSLALAFNRRLFITEIALAGSICLQGLWVLQTGLSLYVEAFIPDGCHRLLDVVTGVEGSTKCDLEDSKLRAVALLDLVFVFHVIFVMVIVLIAFAIIAKVVGVRRVGSYEALPTSSAADRNHVQMKALTGTQA